MYQVNDERKGILTENHIRKRPVGVQRGLEDGQEALGPGARVVIGRRGLWKGSLESKGVGSQCHV